MDRLEELERKVHQIIERNKELKQEISTLRSSCEILTSTNAQLELSLMQEVARVGVLAQEKTTIKDTIDELLKSIVSLEADAQ